MRSTWWKHIIRFAFLILLQAFVLEHIRLPGNLHIILYPLALMMLPYEVSNILLILIGFSTGLLIDICCGTPGLGAFASTFMVFGRIIYFKVADIKDIREGSLSESPLPTQFGWGGFMRYTAWMCVLFFLPYFMLEAGSFRRMAYTLYLSFGSALILFAARMLTALLFVRKAKRQR